MAPTLENGPWEFDTNNVCTEVDDQATGRHGLWQIKESLVALSAWSVVASSDSTAVKNIGDVSPDLWAAWATDVVAGNIGNPHSWVILENSTTGEQFCIDVNVSIAGVNYCYVDFEYSPTGTYATDGTINNRPTATDEIIFEPRTRNWIQLGTPSMVVSAMMSADDKCTRIFCGQRSSSLVGGFYICFEEVYNAPSAWTSTYKRMCLYWDRNVSLSTSQRYQDPCRQYLCTARWYVFTGTGWMSSYVTGEAYAFGSSGDTGDLIFLNSISQTWNGAGGGYPVTNIGLYRSSASNGGGLGRFKDMYWAPDTHNLYDTYPAAATRLWIKIGALLLPWDGSAPVAP